MTEPLYDVAIVGGGPGGLQAALTLARARKRVLLCDAGARRNAAAQQIHNFVTRDGTPPDEFRRIGREQLAAYPNVAIRADRVASIAGTRGAFALAVAADVVRARRVLLCTGMVDEMLPIENFLELWGSAIFQCPYCHGWEVQDRRWGYLVRAGNASMFLPFALMARSWTQDLTVYRTGEFEILKETLVALAEAGIRLEAAPVARLARDGDRLTAVELADGASLPCDVLFTHPPQQQVELVRSLGLAYDEEGYVQTNAVTGETSSPGIYAAGDLATRMQAAVFAAAAAARVAAMINIDLSTERPAA